MLLSGLLSCPDICMILQVRHRGAQGSKLVCKHIRSHSDAATILNVSSAPQCLAFLPIGRSGPFSRSGLCCSCWAHKVLHLDIPKYSNAASRACAELLQNPSLWIYCGFKVSWKPILTYATFGCKTSAGCFEPGSTLQLVSTSGIIPHLYHLVVRCLRAGGAGVRQAGVQQDQGAAGRQGAGHSVGRGPPVPPGPGLPARHHVLPRVPGVRPDRDMRRLLRLCRRAGESHGMHHSKMLQFFSSNFPSTCVMLPDIMVGIFIPKEVLLKLSPGSQTRILGCHSLYFLMHSGPCAASRRPRSLLLLCKRCTYCAKITVQITCPAE